MSHPTRCVAGMDVVMDRAVPPWSAWFFGFDRGHDLHELPWFRSRQRLVVGEEAWHQLLFAIEVKPVLLETDPGPLDARVP